MGYDIGTLQNRKLLEEVKGLKDMFSRHYELGAAMIENKELHHMYQLLYIQTEALISLGYDMLCWTVRIGKGAVHVAEMDGVRSLIEKTKVLCEAFVHCDKEAVWQLAADTEKICELLQYIVEGNIYGAAQFYEENRGKLYAASEREIGNKETHMDSV